MWELLHGVRSLLPLSGPFAVCGANTLPLRPSRCPLERPGQSGACVSEPWQAWMRAQCLAWFLPGPGPGAAVVLWIEAGLDFRIPGTECQVSLSLAG